MTLSALTALTASVAALALAQAPGSGPPPVERVGAWELELEGPGKCVLKRGFADGTRILVFGQAGGIRTLIVNNPEWPAPVAGSLDQLVSLHGGERLPLPPDGRKVELDAVMAARVAESDAIEVVRPDGRVLGRADLSGMRAAEARLPGCMERAAKHPWIVAPPPMVVPAPPPLAWTGRPGLERPAQAKMPLATLLSDEDYPSAAIRAGEEGTVRFTLSVGTDGRIGRCVVTGSSGSETLDSATCQLLTARAVFEPARDSRGRPAADSVDGRIVWRYASEPPPPPPPPR